MTSPRVTELPRRLEPVGPDTFLGGVVLDFPHPPRRSNVVALRPRDARAPRSASTGPSLPPAA